MKHSASVEAEAHSFSRLRALAAHRAIWPLIALALIFSVDGFISPGFFHIRIVEGRLFGNLIDILYRAMPTALVALGMAIVIAMPSAQNESAPTPIVAAAAPTCCGTSMP